MDEGRWRGRTRIVAILDLILSVIVICVTIAIAVFSISSTTAPVEEEDSIVRWIIVAIVTIINLAQVWAAFKLFHSTATAYTAAKSLKMSLIWCTVTLFYLLVEVICPIVTGTYTLFAVNLVIRSTFLIVVYKFTKELDDDIQNESNLDGIVPTALNGRHC